MPKLLSLTLIAFSLLLSATAASAEDKGVTLVGAEESSSIEAALDDAVEADEPEESGKKISVRRGKVAEGAAATGRAPATTDKASSNYHIRAGDVLQITVWREENMDREVLVLPDGTVSFPLIGAFKVQGLTPAQVQSTVKKKLASLIPDASVTVLVKAALGNAISVIGQVGKPGEIVMNHQLSVMQALSQAGGLTPYADEDDIIILRRVDGTETSIEFPYDDVIRGRNLEKNIQLLPGDVVVVPTAGLF